MAPREATKRFGFTAVEKGYITREQLIEAMRVQIKKDTKEGMIVRIGEILLELGYLDESQIEEILNALS